MRLVLGTPLVLALGAALFFAGYWRGRLRQIREERERVNAAVDRWRTGGPTNAYTPKGDLEVKNRQGDVLDLTRLKERSR